MADCVQALFALDHTVFTDDYVRVASSKPTPCFAIFARFLPSSHSKRTVIRSPFWYIQHSYILVGTGELLTRGCRLRVTIIAEKMSMRLLQLHGVGRVGGCLHLWQATIPSPQLPITGSYVVDGAPRGFS